MSLQDAVTLPDEGRYREVVLPEVITLVWKQVDRMLIGLPLIMLAMIQIFLASEVLDSAAALELASLFTFHGAKIGAYDIIGNMIALWVIVPTLQLLRILAGEFYSEVRE